MWPSNKRYEKLDLLFYRNNSFRISMKTTRCNETMDERMKQAFYFRLFLRPSRISQISTIFEISYPLTCGPPSAWGRDWNNWRLVAQQQGAATPLVGRGASCRSPRDVLTRVYLQAAHPRRRQHSFYAPPFISRAYELKSTDAGVAGTSRAGEDAVHVTRRASRARRATPFFGSKRKHAVLRLTARVRTQRRTLPRRRTPVIVTLSYLSTCTSTRARFGRVIDDSERRGMRCERSGTLSVPCLVKATTSCVLPSPWVVVWGRRRPVDRS